MVLDPIAAGLDQVLNEIPLPHLLPGATISAYVWLLVTGLTIVYAGLNVGTVRRWRRNLRTWKWNGTSKLAASRELIIQSAVLTMALAFLVVGIAVSVTTPTRPPDPSARTLRLIFVLGLLAADGCLLLIAWATRSEHVAVYAYSARHGTRPPGE